METPKMQWISRTQFIRCTDEELEKLLSKARYRELAHIAKTFAIKKRGKNKGKMCYSDTASINDIRKAKEICKKRGITYDNVLLIARTKAVATALTEHRTLTPKIKEQYGCEFCGDEGKLSSGACKHKKCPYADKLEDYDSYEDYFSDVDMVSLLKIDVLNSRPKTKHKGVE